MLLLGAILLAIFVVPWPWGLVVVIAGGTIDVVESLAMLRWSRRRRAVTGGEPQKGQRAIVATPTQVRIAGELWEARSSHVLVRGEEVVVRGVEELTLLVD
jgi:membrane protein implicated in regulation of membrane protease activity